MGIGLHGFSAAPRAVDLAVSRVYVLVGKSGFVGHVHAVEGRLAAGQAMLGVQGEINANTQQQTNGNMLGPEVLDVARHPTARFDIRSAVRLRGGFSIRQTDFGMKPYAKFGGMVGVADELKIWGDIVLPAVGAP